MDAAEFVGLDSPTGVVATTDVDAALADCDAVAYMASGDIRPEEAVNDIERCLRAGSHVVTPSLYSLYDPRSAPPEWVERLTGGRRGGRLDAPRQRGRPGLGQRRARGDRRGPVHPDPVHPLPGDLRLLDLQPAARGEGAVRVRRLDGRGADDAVAVDPDHGVGRQPPADRPRSRHGDRRDHRRGRASSARNVGRHRDGARSRRAPRAPSGSR